MGERRAAPEAGRLLTPPLPPLLFLPPPPPGAPAVGSSPFRLLCMRDMAPPLSISINFFLAVVAEYFGPSLSFSLPCSSSLGSPPPYTPPMATAPRPVVLRRSKPC